MSRKNGTGKRQVTGHGKEIIKGPQCGKPAIDGCWFIALLQAMGDVAIYIFGCDLCRRFLYKRKEERQVTAVVNAGA
jgi:hypothetical protein